MLNLCVNLKATKYGLTSLNRIVADKSHRVYRNSKQGLCDLATVNRTKENAILTNQMLALLLNEWPRTIAETMVIITKFIGTLVRNVEHISVIAQSMEKTLR